MTSSLVSLVYNRVICCLDGHKPVIRDDMRVILHAYFINPPGVPPVHVERATEFGETVCARCACKLLVEGVRVRKLSI